MLERRAASGLPPTAYSQRPQTSQRRQHERSTSASPSDDEDRVREPVDRAAADRLHDRRHARDERPVRGPEREAAHDAERRERDDERVRHAAVDEDEPVRARRPRARCRGSRRSTSTLELVCSKTIAPTTPESAIVEPTERSMPRVTITSSWPSASTAITEVCEKTLPMLRLVKKTGVVRLTTTISRSRISAGPGAQRRAARPGAGGSGRSRRSPRDPRCSLRLRRRHGHSPPTATSTGDQTGPSGNSYSSSDAGSISML